MIAIPKSNEARNNYPFWRPVEDLDGKPLRPVVFCKCQMAVGLNNHAIDENGIISPSFYHMKKEAHELTPTEVNGCGFHEYIKLEGYNGIAFPPTPAGK